MTTRHVLIALYAVAIGCLVLLFDAVVTTKVSSVLDLAVGKIDQAVIVYAFGAIGAVLGLVLVGFTGRGAEIAAERRGRRRR
jgi:hypothetical protein